jgi:hypothetical protein
MLRVLTHDARNHTRHLEGLLADIKASLSHDTERAKRSLEVAFEIAGQLTFLLDNFDGSRSSARETSYVAIDDLSEYLASDVTAATRRAAGIVSRVPDGLAIKVNLFALRWVVRLLAKAAYDMTTSPESIAITLVALDRADNNAALALGFMFDISEKNRQLFQTAQSAPEELIWRTDHLDLVPLAAALFEAYSQRWGVVLEFPSASSVVLTLSVPSRDA